MVCLSFLLFSLGGGGLVGCVFWVGNGLMYLNKCVKVMTWVWSFVTGACCGLDGVMIWV